MAQMKGFGTYAGVGISCAPEESAWPIPPASSLDSSLTYQHTEDQSISNYIDRLEQIAFEINKYGRELVNVKIGVSHQPVGNKGITDQILA